MNTLPSAHFTESEKLKNLEKSICLHRWDFPCVKLDTGEFKTCCRTLGEKLNTDELKIKGPDLVLNSNFNISRRLEMLAGVKHSDCNQCWDLEARGAPSPRKGLVPFLSYMKKRTGQSAGAIIEQCLDPINNSQILHSNIPTTLELSLGNFCNLACVYCDHNYSSRWEKELVKFNELAPDYKKTVASAEVTENFWLWFETVGIYKLDILFFIGGETILNKNLFSTLDRLENIVKKTSANNFRKSKLSLQIVSNFSIPENIFNLFLKKIESLAPFFQFKILASMESTSKKAEFIRYGLSWNLFEKNVHALLKTNSSIVSFGFIATLNIFSVSSLPDFLKFVYSLYIVYKRPIYLGSNMVAQPDHLSLMNLTPDFAKYFDESIAFLSSLPLENFSKINLHNSWSEYILFLNTLKNGLSENTANKNVARAKLAVWIKKYDQRRSTNFLALFPEYKNFIALCEGADHIASEQKKKNDD